MENRQIAGLFLIVGGLVYAVFAPRIRDANEEVQSIFGYRRPATHWARTDFLQRLYGIPAIAVGVYLFFSSE